MPTSAATLIQRVRRYVGDWPELDTLTASAASTATTLTVADATRYTPNKFIELGAEVLTVTTNAAGTSVGVRRAMRGSTAASHANSATVLLNPSYTSLDILDALNAGIDASFPIVYKPVLDVSLAIDSDVYEYTVPNMPSTTTPIPIISSVELKESGELDYRATRSWVIRRGATPKIVFKRLFPASATVRVNGYGPFPKLASTADSLDALWPLNADYPLVEFAASYLLTMGEAQRLRRDANVNDQREQANRTGDSIRASNLLLQRFYAALRNSAAMPPMPRHVRGTI